MKVDEFIKQKINEGMSQSAFARKCGISQPLVNNVLQGHSNVQLHIAQRIAHAYGLPLAYFTEDATPLINDPQPEYTRNITPDERAILDMLKDDPDLTRRARRFIQFEKQDSAEDITDHKKVA